MSIIWSNWNHEPMDHLRRMGNPAISIFTLGEWMPQWYDRLHGEELIQKAAEMGINTIYTHFFKGFGLVHEHDEMERAKELVKIAHRYGIDVIGYCQLGSLYYETMLDEAPDLENWVARDENGGFPHYGASQQHYYRWRPCLESREFINYFKRVLSYGVEHVGLNGFHFDNATVAACYCPRCQAAFRAFLTENIPNPREVCGLAHFGNVRIPPLLENDEVHDPICLWRARFRHDQLRRAKTEIFDYVKSIGGKYVLQNSGLAHPNFTGCSDSSLVPASCELVFTENGNSIRSADGKTVTQILAYKMGWRFGFKVFDSSWERGPDKGYISPRDADSIERFLAQGMIFGDIAGAPWFVRSCKTGDRVILDDPLQYETAKKVFDYYKAHAALYSGVPVSQVKLLYAADTFYGWPAGGFRSFMEAGDLLADRSVPYAVIKEEDLDELAPGTTVVLPDMRFAPARQYKKLADTAARGVRIVRLGAYGLYNENGKERDHADPIRNLRGIPGVLTELPEDVRIPMQLPGGKPVEGVLVDTAVGADGAFVLHLLRADNNTSVDTLEVMLRSERIHAGMEAALYSLNGDCTLGSACIADGKAVFVVHGLHTMAGIALR